MLKILFMGTPEFGVKVLDALYHNYEIVGVVTQPDKEVGRHHELTPSPVKAYAVSKGIKVFQPEHIKEEYDNLIALGADLIVTAAYGQFVGMKLLDAPKYRAINCHGSLLPKYRGGSPIQTAVKNGETETGISIMYMEKAMDSGDILAVEKIPILDSDTSGTMFDKLGDLAAKMILEVIPKLIEGKINPIKQDESLVSFAYNITKEEELIDFNQTARQIFNHIRAFNPNPIAHMDLKGDSIKVYSSVVVDEKTNEAPGTILLHKKGHLMVACGNNTVLELLEVQPAGKKVMAGRDFINGGLRKYL